MLLRILALQIGPCGTLVNQVINHIDQLGHWNNDLLARVSLTKSDSVMFNCALGVNGDSKWNSQIVSSCVAASNGNTGGVSTVRDVGIPQQRQHLLNIWNKLRRVGHRHDHTLIWSNWCWEGENRARNFLVVRWIVLRAHPVGLFQETVNDTSDTKGWLDDGRNIVASINGLSSLFNGECLGRNGKLSTVFEGNLCLAVILEL
mmetsp:Transcript_10152/g.37776  ORF Transcript_10152/g.37776 Transcript_10152/m.37776 type:complete len:203 (+) Transcript_10152:1848-2456(+)